MRRIAPKLMWVGLILSILSLTACSPQPTISPTLGSTVSPTATVTPPENDTDRQVIRTYHTLMMLERADDLIMTAIQKIQSGELPLGDATPRNPYTDAFPIAIDAFNKTTPPSGMLNNGWKNVSKVTAQYNNVYAALIQGSGISTKDLVTLRMLRQLLTNYQNYAEGYLKQSGRGVEFFESQRQAAELHFQKSYGEKPLPTLPVPPTSRPSATPQP
ncbi:MAG: hypothetical protein PHQ40_09890 [Anaerolineaceae bacterium]|nr:hypothetical protein [Anaerolineaceae bacterium]